MTPEISKFFRDQLSVWPLASKNFRSIKSADTAVFKVGDVEVVTQHNPCRLISSTAEIDEASLAARPCFLCTEHRQKEQFHLRFEGRKGRHYHIQVNPYPIFPAHLVIPRDSHVPQSIWHYFVDMMDFARMDPSYLVFYNGPYSGASAPDHMHFQACPKDSLPLQVAIDRWLDTPGHTPLTSQQDAELYHYDGFVRGVYALRAKTPKSLAKLFYRLVDCAPMRKGEPEPRLNLFTYCHEDEFRSFVTLRSEIRPHFYYAEGPEHLTISPGAADMAGVLVCPRKEDYDRLTAPLIRQILDEVSISEEDEKMVAWRLTRKQAKLEVVVMKGESICFEMISDGAGPQTVTLREGRLDYGGALYDELYFDSVTRSTNFGEPCVILHGGPRPLTFAGSLKLYIQDGQICASNYIGVENYLLSTLSKEVAADAPLEEVKALSCIRRAELLANPRGCKPYEGLTDGYLDVVRDALDITWGKV